MVVNDHDEANEMMNRMETSVTIVKQVFKGVEIPPALSSTTADSPVITKSAITQGGDLSISFNKEITIPPMFFNLTSENEGPSYFNLTLIVNEANLKALADEIA